MESIEVQSAIVGICFVIIIEAIRMPVLYSLKILKPNISSRADS